MRWKAAYFFSEPNTTGGASGAPSYQKGMATPSCRS
jgi:hypothetical protein